jgi:hypothetical protein
LPNVATTPYCGAMPMWITHAFAVMRYAIAGSGWPRTFVWFQYATTVVPDFAWLPPA